MIDLWLVKKALLHYVKDMRTMRGMRQNFSDNNVLLCKVRLVGAWTKRRKVLDRLQGLEVRQ